MRWHRDHVCTDASKFDPCFRMVKTTTGLPRPRSEDLVYDEREDLRPVANRDSPLPGIVTSKDEIQTCRLSVWRISILLCHFNDIENLYSVNTYDDYTGFFAICNRSYVLTLTLDIHLQSQKPQAIKTDLFCISGKEILTLDYDVILHLS